MTKQLLALMLAARYRKPLPILAGWLFDRTAGYGTAVLIAGGLNLLAVGVAFRLPKP